MKKSILLVLVILSCISQLFATNIDTIQLEEIQLEPGISIPYITHINYDLDGNLWITTLYGLYKYDGYTMHKYDSNENQDHGLVKDRTYRTHLSNDGTFWIAGEYSIYQYDPLIDKVIRRSEEARKDHDDLYNISYFDIEDIDNRYMALGTKAGLHIYDKERSQIVGIDSLVTNYTVDGYSTSAHVLLIEKDPSNSNLLWLLTRSGIYTYDCLTKESKRIYYDENINFEKLNERGFSLVVKTDFVYFLVNFMNAYRLEKATSKVEEIPQTDLNDSPQHMRNLLPSKNGILAVFIKQGIINFQENGEQKSIPSFFEDGTECNGMSYVGLDHFGRYTFVYENTKFLKSSLRTYTRPIEQKIWAKNFEADGKSISTITGSTNVLQLKKHERNIQFDVGLTNRSHKDEEKYFIKVSDNQDWIKFDSNQIVLDDLAVGKQNIICKITSNNKTYEKRIATLEIEPYFYETRLFTTLILLTFGGILSIFLYILNLRKTERKSYEKKMLELEMNTLRSQMNPHFLFNSINSIKSYVISKNNDETAEYLTQFAKLIRMILENSRKKYLTIGDEVEMLNLYVLMEQKRLNFSFQYELVVNDDVDTNFLIAPMLIQPYVENAIWHGLMNKYGDKTLNIHIQNHPQGLQVSIIDNGIGREESHRLNKENPTSKKSLGTKITEDRINIIKKIYKINASVEIKDLYQDQEAKGTEVKIVLPIIQEIKHHD